MKVLVICHAHEMGIGIDSATEPIHTSCGIENRQRMCEPLIDSIQVIDKRLPFCIAPIGCVIETENHSPGIDCLKVILLDAAQVAKVLPEGTKIRTRSKRELVRLQRTQKVHRQAASELPLR